MTSIQKSSLTPVFPMDPNSNSNTESEEVKRRSGKLWDCVGRQRDEFGGYLYRFKLKEEYNDLSPGKAGEEHYQAQLAKNDEIFPAVEPGGFNLLFLDPQTDKESFANQLTDRDIEGIVRTHLRHEEAKELLKKVPCEVLAQELRSEIEEKLRENSIKKYISYFEVQQLGGFLLEQEPDGVYLLLPDREALLNRWEKLRESRPELPPLDIVSSDGVAGDLEFIDAYLHHNALLSTGEEFVHDAIAHVIPVLIEMLVSLSYTKERGKITERVDQIYQKIIAGKKELLNAQNKIQFAELEAAFAGLVDTLSNGDSQRAEKKINDWPAIVKAIWNLPDWGSYLKNRFGSNNIDVQKIVHLWNQINLKY